MQILHTIFIQNILRIEIFNYVRLYKMSKIAKFLITDFKRDWSKPSIKFFRSSGAYGYIIWLTIMNAHFEKIDLTVEKIVNDVENYGSRRTTLDFINKAADANFIKKLNSTQDKRKILIQPTKITIREFSEWSNEFISGIS